MWDGLEENETRANSETTPLRPVYFRYLTILAYHIFLTLQVKCTILEVGIGGRYDSTNIVPKPIVTGITTLGLDHTALLGNTIEEIAYQKAGIFKPGCEAISVSQSEGAAKVLEEEAKKVGTSSYKILPALATWPSLQNIKLGISGSHQASNAQLATELYRSFLRSPAGQEHFRSGSSFSGHDDDLAFTEAKGLTEAKWPGRCQTVRSEHGSSPVWFLDGAHTTESLESCAAWFLRASMEEKHDSGPTRRSLIFNTTHDRKSEELLSGMMKAVEKELAQLGRGKEAVETFFESAVFCTNTTYKDGISAGGEPEGCAYNSPSADLVA